ncbi:hypothetical protein [uncultured Campylobacter sp.]|uniref:hypothetical protein n=1 Tax=uncultured Campylobacter sp. TaxID=218934 RepID=UPI002608541D|nr:hypothetical protein [uncultured Campylobacter sp.]
MSQKRLAIQFFGHTRTYKKTYEGFFKNIVEPNLKDGWQIDIFIHTWDMSSSSDGSWHNRQDLFDMHLLSQDDIENIRKIYNPKKFLVEHLQEGIHGGSESKKRGNRLREKYEIENNIKYDYVLYTRMDILFALPLNIQRYIDLYTKGSIKNFPLPQKHCFAAFNPFVRMHVIDIRDINECDIVYFTNYPHDEFILEKRLELFIIMIDYKLYRDFFLQRRDFIHGYNRSLEAKLKIEQDKLSKTNLQLNIKNQELTKANTELKHLKDTINSIPIKKQSLEILNLEQDLINKKLKAQILEKELRYDYNAIQENKELKEQIKALQLIGKENIKQQSIYTAKSRIHNQLSYKLGQAMIANSKSIWGYIRMPYVLSYIKDMHKKEQIAYNEKIKTNPSLKLPPLESYPDYKEALKEKECLTYKLGEAMIEADKSPLKLGYLTIWFKCKNIQKEFKKR